jgi:glycosyltransferase involved in cell wall biosynthesis
VLLNDHDYKYFSERFKKTKIKIEKVNGVGVDCLRYKKGCGLSDRRFRVLLPARMLREKGVYEFVAAAEQIKKYGLNIEFVLAGKPDPGSPTSIPTETLLEWQKIGLVDWTGHVDDMVKMYNSVDVVILPSYREGLPTSLTEAAASGLPLIATSVPGCEDVVKHCVNGFQIPIKNSWAIISAVLILYYDDYLRGCFGKESRRLAELLFDSKVVYGQRVALYKVRNE